MLRKNPKALIVFLMICLIAATNVCASEEWITVINEGKQWVLQGDFTANGRWSSVTNSASVTVTKNYPGGHTSGTGSDNCLLFDLSNSNGAGMQIQQTVKVSDGGSRLERGSIYRVSFYAKLENADNYEISRLFFRKNGGSINDEDAYRSDIALVSIIRGDGDWRLYNAYLTCNMDSDEYIIMIQFANKDAAGNNHQNLKLYIDDIDIDEVVGETNEMTVGQTQFFVNGVEVTALSSELLAAETATVFSATVNFLNSTSKEGKAYMILAVYSYDSLMRISCEQIPLVSGQRGALNMEYSYTPSDQNDIQSFVGSTKIKAFVWNGLGLRRRALNDTAKLEIRGDF